MTRHRPGEVPSIGKQRRWGWYWDRLICQARRSTRVRPQVAPRTGVRTRATRCRSCTSTPSTSAREGPEAGDPEPPGPAWGRSYPELSGLPWSLCDFVVSLPDNERERARPRPTTPRSVTSTPDFDPVEHERRVREQAAWARRQSVGTDADAGLSRPGGAP